MNRMLIYLIYMIHYFDIINGKRLMKIDEMSDEMFELIENSWLHNPKERKSIDEIIEKLEQLYEN